MIAVEMLMIGGLIVGSVIGIIYIISLYLKNKEYSNWDTRKVCGKCLTVVNDSGTLSVCPKCGYKNNNGNTFINKICRFSGTKWEYKDND